MSDIVEQYLATWNATDPDTRRALLERHWASNASYVDPMVDFVAGHHALDAVMAAVRGQFPDFVFTPVGTADAHHAVVRFRWGLGPSGAEPVVVGSDIVTIDADGRIAGVVGFLDRVPA